MSPTINQAQNPHQHQQQCCLVGTEKAGRAVTPIFIIVMIGLLLIIRNRTRTIFSIRRTNLPQKDHHHHPKMIIKNQVAMFRQDAAMREKLTHLLFKQKKTESIKTRKQNFVISIFYMFVDKFFLFQLHATSMLSKKSE